MWRRISAAILIALFVAGCSSGQDETTSPPTDGESESESNEPPIIEKIEVSDDGGAVEVGQERSIKVKVGETKSIEVTAADPDGDELRYAYEVQRGSVGPTIGNDEPAATYTAPDEPGADSIRVLITDEHDGDDDEIILIDVVPADTSDNDGVAEPDPGPVVKITSPTDGDERASAYEVEGTAESVPESSNLWLVVEVENLFYPQGRLLVVDGQWGLGVRMGGSSGDIGREFDLLVLDTSDSLSEQYQMWLDDSSDFAGLPIPDDAAGLDEVTVTLSEFP